MPTDLDEIRRRLLSLGFGLSEVPGGFVIWSLCYDTLKAGTEAEPLTLSEVRRFVA